MTADTLVTGSPADEAQTTPGGPGMTLLIHSSVSVGYIVLGSLSAWSVSPLFAETDAGGLAIVVALSGAVGAAGKWLADRITAGRKNRLEDDDRDYARLKAEHVKEISHYEKLIARYESTIAKMTGWQRRAISAEANIRANEMLMRSRKDEFIPYTPPDEDSGDDHPAVMMHGPTDPNGQKDPPPPGVQP